MQFIKDYIKTKKKKRQIRKFISEIHFDLINTVLHSSRFGFTQHGNKKIDNLCCLISKYETKLNQIQ